jgi:hypothetical protein
MRCFVGAAMVASIFFVDFLAGTDQAGAEVVVAINKSKQRMAVLVDGVEQHVWKVSTGLGGGPPSGTYRPERLERKWFSHKYGMSPMPHSIFFHEGYAIHGTIYVSRLGNKASHGCVRLHPADAATLFNLVRSHGMSATSIVVSNSEYGVTRIAPQQIDASASRRAPNESPATSAPDPVPASTGTVPVSSESVAAPEFEE